MQLSANNRWKQTGLWTLGVGCITEAVTLAMRFGVHLSAVEFNKTAPLLLQIHHMLYGAPLLLIAPFVWRFRAFSAALVGIACGLILSDAAHHLLILPLTVGNMGWHWP